MTPLILGMVHAIPEIATAATVARGVPTIASILGLPVIPTKVVYMQPDREIEQIPLEQIEERDRRLVIALGIEQYPRHMLMTFSRRLTNCSSWCGGGRQLWPFTGLSCTYRTSSY
ncbi:unnamed protein product [Camellia sinensis]